MLVEQEQEAYFNFVSSINSEATRKNYEYCLSKFMQYCNKDLDSLLKLPQLELSNLIIKYLVSQKISSQYKLLIMASIKHACEMNDVILNWKKIKKFIKSEKTDNEINGKDRGYTHQEIQQILEFSDQRLKMAFLILASTGIRIGALQSIRIGDLERIDTYNLYKIIVYRGDNEQYFTFCTPECAIEIDTYLEFRKRRGEHITVDSYLMAKKFSLKTEVKGKAYKDRALWAVLEECISNCGIRKIDHVNPFKRKQVPIFHGFRKFFTKQLMDSKVDKAIVELLLGHNIGLTGRYYKPTEVEMFQEYQKAIDNLTIDPANRLRKKVQVLEIEKSQIEALQQEFDSFKQEVDAMKRRKSNNRLL
jgi:integrase